MAIKLKPDHAEAYNYRGIAHREIDEFYEAIEDFTMVIKLKPDHAEAYAARGKEWLYRHEWDKAKADFIAARNLGVDGVAFFHRMYEDVEDFESDYDVQVSKDLAEILTRR